MPLTKVTAGVFNVNDIFGFRNRIINGDMRIDQRNAGASVAVTTSDPYIVDRWVCLAAANSRYTAQRNAGSVTPPAGFTNYLGITSVSSGAPGSTDVYAINQYIEGLNIADFAWGTSSAQTITLSFWVRSSLTGSFGGTINNTGSPSYRSYPFSYTINSANTWEQKTITITGDTSGTWLTTNDVGLRLRFSLGMGSSFLGTAGAWATGFLGAPTGSTNVIATNGATFYITGVQLEKGSQSTPFDYRPYGTELQLCQRYYQKISLTANPEFWGTGYWNTTTGVQIYTPFITTMRAAPTALETSGVPSQYSVRYAGGRDALSAGPTFGAATTFGIHISATSSATRTAGNGSMGTVEAATFLAWSAEL